MGKIAFVFSGQGAQYSGMGKELYECSDAAKNVFLIADGIRKETSKQCFTADKEELSETINTQPCLYCVDLAAAESLREAGIKADAVAGFSLGEVAALTFAKVFTYEDGFSMVCKRAEFMHKAASSSNGAMAAVLRLSNIKVQELSNAYENVFPVNYNCPGQLVVAGEKNELAKFVVAVQEAGGRALLLAVSGAFHSPFMNDAKESLYKELINISINEPIMPVYSNNTAKPYQGDIRKLIAAQINSPVLWQRSVEQMIEDGIDTFIEVGAGKTLCGLIKKINPSVTVYNVEDKESLTLTLKAFGIEH